MIEEHNIGMSVDPTTRQRAVGTAVGDLALCPTWTTGSTPEHVVQFYESDSFLLDALSGFIGRGLKEGETCIVVATKEHRDAVEERFQQYGQVVDAVKSSGQYIALDAADCLSQL